MSQVSPRVFRQWQSVSEGYQNLPFHGPPAEVEEERKRAKAEETLAAKKQAEAEADVAAERRDRFHELSEQEEESDEGASERDSEDGVLNEEISMLELQMQVRKKDCRLFSSHLSLSDMSGTMFEICIFYFGTYVSKWC